MDLLERARQKLEESKKVFEEKNIAGEKDQKVAHARPDRKTILDIKNSKKNSKMGINAQFDPQLVDQKINEIDLKIEKKFNEFNERLLKLLNIGIKHELTIENLMMYLKTHERKTKLYKLADYFSEAKLLKIKKMLKYLHSTGVIKKDRNNWYSLK